MGDTFEVLDVVLSEIPGEKAVSQPRTMKLRCVGCGVDFTAKRAASMTAGTFSRMGGVNTYNVSCPSGKHRGFVTVPEASD